MGAAVLLTMRQSKYSLSFDARGGVQNSDAPLHARGGPYFFVSAPACRPATRSSRYCVSKGTGRPVAPFLSPMNQTKPTKTRNAHKKILGMRERKLAAVMVPPSRPPMLAM